jgi:starch synthase (maltosyl-transferring)
MQRHRPVTEGARIYNLFPLLAGPMDRWRPHMARAREMGFNWIFINSFHVPGFSGSLYSIKDYYGINPLLLNPESPAAPLDQLKGMVSDAREKGLHPMMDLVINHTAVDSPLIAEHPEWYLRDRTGGIVHPSVWEGDKRVAVWGDLAEIDNEGSSDRERLWRYWIDLALFYRDIGFEGFRCDAAYQVTDALWQTLIAEVKDRYPETLFFAESLGCTMEQTIGLARSGFDYTFNSSKYWDYEEAWCLKQYHENAAWAPSVSFAESHDTERLYKELRGDLDRMRQRYLFAALFAAGVLMPMGFEFGFKKKLHVVKTRPFDWEKTDVDLTGFIRDVHGVKESCAVFNEDGPVAVLDGGDPNVLCLKKSTFDGRESALILLNKDRKRSRRVRFASLASLFPEVPSMANLLPQSTGKALPDDASFELPPSGFRVLGHRP